jgi:DNA-binding HxlR family transcriptional regulator
MKTILKRSTCPISFSLDFIGDKWTLLILRDMIFEGKSSYSEFLESDEKIATNILNDRLNMLHREGFLIKSIAPTNKSKFIYGLSEKALQLLPVITEILIWGSANSADNFDKQVVNKALKNKTKFIRDLKENLREKREKLVDILE